MDTGLIGGNAVHTFAAEAALIWGPFSAQAEYAAATTTDAVTGGVDRGTVTFQGWYAQVSYFLTGESRAYDRRLGRFGRVRPKQNLWTMEDDGCGKKASCFHAGAWELAARYSVIEPTASHVAKIVFKNVDVSLMTPSLPEWTKADAGLRRIALTDRQWNRQQVKFDLKSDIEISGGDGFEKDNLFSAELAKNCLNAGLWEVLLFTKGPAGKQLYYQGWFTFPLGHYGRLFEHNTGLKFNDHWYYLEHWFDPAGTVMNLDGLRRVTSEADAATKYDPAERLILGGEQVRKRRTTTATNVVKWQDFFDGRSVTFASFIPPGRYSSRHPHGNHFKSMDRFKKAIVRTIASPASPTPLHKIELQFECSHAPSLCRFFVSGLDVTSIPQLPIADYANGLYMPMGIGIPTFFQSYADLLKRPPTQSSFFSLLLDADNRWIDHHAVGIDGPVLQPRSRQPTTVAPVFTVLRAALADRSFCHRPARNEVGTPLNSQSRSSRFRFRHPIAASCVPEKCALGVGLIHQQLGCGMAPARQGVQNIQQCILVRF